MPTPATVVRTELSALFADFNSGAPGRDTQALASAREKRMLAEYEAPPIDAGVRESLEAFVAKRKEAMPDAFDMAEG